MKYKLDRRTCPSFGQVEPPQPLDIRHGWSFSAHVII